MTHSRDLEAPPDRVAIGTRGSALALAQTGLMRAALEAYHPGLVIEVVRITTRGDVVLDKPLAELGGKGLFVGEIEDALREGRVDIAVHSAKDLPSALPADMVVGAYPPRADARDVLVSADAAAIPALAPGTRIGTSSPRRACQLRALRPDLDLLGIRGNVDTRLRKLDAGEYDALVLAAAGLDRLGVHDPRLHPIPPDVMVPAVGQGALALEVRAGDTAVLGLIASLNDPDTAEAVEAERAFLAAVGGGCNTAVAAHATVAGPELVITGMIGAVDGRLVRDVRQVPRADGIATARTLAAALLAEGGVDLLDDHAAGTPLI